MSLETNKPEPFKVCYPSSYTVYAIDVLSLASDGWFVERENLDKPELNPEGRHSCMAFAIFENEAEAKNKDPHAFAVCVADTKGEEDFEFRDTVSWLCADLKESITTFLIPAHRVVLWRRQLAKYMKEELDINPAYLMSTPEIWTAWFADPRKHCPALCGGREGKTLNVPGHDEPVPVPTASDWISKMFGPPISSAKTVQLKGAKFTKAPYLWRYLRYSDKTKAADLVNFWQPPAADSVESFDKLFSGRTFSIIFHQVYSCSYDPSFLVAEASIFKVPIKNKPKEEEEEEEEPPKKKQKRGKKKRAPPKRTTQNAFMIHGLKVDLTEEDFYHHGRHSINSVVKRAIF